MRRVLVPLDGSELAAAILPDARRVAGLGGTVILIQQPRLPGRDFRTDTLDTFSVERADDYLTEVAKQIEPDGAQVEIHLVGPGDTADIIDGAAITCKADMIACSTHGRGPFGRLVRGGVAWKVLAHSSVPVLMRNTARASLSPTTSRKILVPLDQSEFAEAALPLVRTLQEEWNATVFLTTVIPDVLPYDTGSTYYTSPFWLDDVRTSAAEYLRHAASMVPGAQLRVLMGPTVIELVEAVRQWHVTDVVMTSHGRTGLARAFLGSVADRLIHELSVPVIVIPSFAVGHAIEHAPGVAVAGPAAPVGP